MNGVQRMSSFQNLPGARQHSNMLFDFYGALLTEKQQEVFAMHNAEDCSFAEIGEALDITPQAVADLIKRAQGKMQRFEEMLGMVEKLHSQREIMHKISAIFDKFDRLDENDELESLRSLIESLLL